MRAGDGQQGASDGPQSWLGVILACRLAAAGTASSAQPELPPSGLSHAACWSLAFDPLHLGAGTKPSAGMVDPHTRQWKPASSPPASGGVPVVHTKLADVSGTSC
jgi:hypothetical protein